MHCGCDLTTTTTTVVEVYIKEKALTGTQRQRVIQRNCFLL